MSTTKEQAEAFEELNAGWRERSRLYLLKQGVCEADAEDLVQAAMMATLTGYRAGRGAGLGTYFTRALRSRLKDYWRCAGQGVMRGRGKLSLVDIERPGAERDERIAINAYPDPRETEQARDRREALSVLVEEAERLGLVPELETYLAHDGVMTFAAAFLGINRLTMKRRIERLKTAVRTRYNLSKGE